MPEPRPRPDRARHSCRIKVLRLAVVGAIERASVTEACFVVEVVRSSYEWSWLSLLAGLIALAIALDGFNRGSTGRYRNVGPPCCPGSPFDRDRNCERTLRCFAVSLPIGYLLDDARDTPGILASQSIDFPPVLLATSLGFAFARKLQRSRVPRIAAG